MLRLPPRSTRTDTLVPYTTLVRSRRHIVAQADSPVPMPVFADGFAAAEAEFLLRVSTPPPADQKRFTTEEATAHIDMVHLAIEIARSPLPTIKDLGPTVTISDFGTNNAHVIVPAITHWPSADTADWPVSTEESRGRKECVSTSRSRGY